MRKIPFLFAFLLVASVAYGQGQGNTVTIPYTSDPTGLPCSFIMLANYNGNEYYCASGVFAKLNGGGGGGWPVTTSVHVQSGGTITIDSGGTFNCASGSTCSGTTSFNTTGNAATVTDASIPHWYKCTIGYALLTNTSTSQTLSLPSQTGTSCASMLLAARGVANAIFAMHTTQFAASGLTHLYVSIGSDHGGVQPTTTTDFLSAGLDVAAPISGTALYSFAYVSGPSGSLTCTTGQVVDLTFANGATGTLACTGSNALSTTSTAAVTAVGSGFSTAPTSATCSAGTSGTACSGTITLTSTLNPGYYANSGMSMGPLPVAQNLQITFTAVGANLNTLSAGSVGIDLQKSTAP